jgi:hypothetical protein
MRKNIALAVTAALVALGSTAFAADNPPDSSEQARQARMDAALQDERSGKPAADESLGTRIKQDAASAGHAISNGAHRAGRAVAHAASATGHAISNGMHRTGQALHNATHRSTTHTKPASTSASGAS